MTSVQRRTPARRGARLLAAAIAALAVAPASAPAEILEPGPWRGPVAVAREDGAQFSSVAAALAADGRGLIAWASRRPDYAIAGADVAADGTAGAPFTLSAPGDHAAAPLVGMSAAGEAVVAWRTGQGGRGVSVCVRPASGGACAVQRVSPPNRRAVLQSLAVAADGAAVVAWLQRTGDGWRAAVAQRGGPHEGFGAARLVGPTGTTEAKVAIGPRSAAVALSRARGRRGSEVRLATWPRTGSPGRTRAVSPASHVAVSPRLAIAGDESAVVAWERMHGRNAFAIVHARFRYCAADGCAGSASRLAYFGDLVLRLGPPLGGRRQASNAGLTVAAAANRLVLGWIHLAGDDDSPSQIRAAQYSAGSLRATARVSDARYSGFDPQLAAAGDRTVVAYREYGRPGVRDGLVVARIADGGTLGFGPLAGISTPALIQQSANLPRVAVGPSGAALAAFTNYGNGGGEVSMASVAGRSPVPPTGV